ncbi:MAG: peroxidase-related enzyme [Candidatus Acidiferrales bacterium]
MAHIKLPEGLPGIRGPMVFSPETTKPLTDLAHVLLTGPHTLTPAEREVIATYVSSQNDCFYCQTCHGSTAAQHLGGSDADYELIAELKRDYQATAISPKMKALLAIAGQVQKGGKHVTTEDIERARQHGATDKEIHDTVLIAAAFCMFNRYVDGLATWQPSDPEIYREIGKLTSQLGYAGRDYKKPLRAIVAKQSNS